MIDLYTHVRDEALRRGDGEYLPELEGSPKYKQVYYVRSLYRRGQLRSADYALLAHQPIALARHCLARWKR